MWYGVKYEMLILLYDWLGFMDLVYLDWNKIKKIIYICRVKL